MNRSVLSAAVVFTLVSTFFTFSFVTEIRSEPLHKAKPSEGVFADVPGSGTKLKDIVDTAIAAGRFDHFVKMIRLSGLADKLKYEGPFTVFAPTDEAFERLPKITFDNLMAPGNRSDLKRLIETHVADGFLLAFDLSGETSLETLNGHRLKIRKEADSLMVDLAAITVADMECTNGIIHAIDTVIMGKEGSGHRGD